MRSGKSSRRPNRIAKHNQGGRNRFHGASALTLSISFFSVLSVWRSLSAPAHSKSGYAQISRRKPITRTRLLSETGSDYMGLSCVDKKDAPSYPLRHNGFFIFSAFLFRNQTRPNSCLYYSTKTVHCKENLENQEKILKIRKKFLRTERGAQEFTGSQLLGPAFH